MSVSDVIALASCIVAIMALAYSGQQTNVQKFEFKVRVLIIEYDIYRKNYRLFDWIARVHKLFSNNKSLFMVNYSEEGSILYDTVEELFNSGDVRVYPGSKVETVLVLLKQLVNFE